IMVTPVVLLFRILGALLGLLWDKFAQLWDMGVKFAQSLGLLSESTAGATDAWGGLLKVLANLTPLGMLGKALRGLIQLLNLIPGVSIDAEFGDLPAAPQPA
ncbi:hypothetical protein P3D64_29755, partial [Pseudomonas aeruginosa]